MSTAIESDLSLAQCDIQNIERCYIDHFYNSEIYVAMLAYQFESAYNISIGRAIGVGNEICDVGFEGFM